MKALACAVLTVLAIAPCAWAGGLPTSEDIDPYMLEAHPELRYQMQTKHFLGLLGVGSVAGEPAYTADLAGWTYWDQRFFAEANLGGMLISPKTFGIAKDPQNPNDQGNMLFPIGEAMLGYNVVGVRDQNHGLEPLFNVNDRTFVTLGVGAAAGFASTKTNQWGFGMTVGPMIGLRYKLMDWHNVNTYGRYMYGLNRAADSYELGLHSSFGNDVVEFGYRGGQVAAYLQRDAQGNVSLLPGPTPVPYNAWFLRLSRGY